MAKKDSQMDEGIIDLTELIEPGTASGQAAATPPAMEEDFEAVLAQTSASAPASPHKVDPNESLDMSGMGGIDNLLESLDIPPQPRESAPAGAGGDLDSVLDDLLPPDEQPKKSAPAEKPKPAAAPEDFDLESLLNEEPAVSEPAVPEAPAKSGGKSELDADLDDILASFDEPAGSVSAPEKKPSAAMAPQSVGLNDSPDKPVVSAPAPAPAADELDDLLGDLEQGPAPAPRPAPAQPAPAQPSPAEMDDLLSELDEVAPAPEKEKTALQSGPGGDTDARGVPAPMTPVHSSPALPAEMPEREAVAGKNLPAWPTEMIAGICQGIASAQSNGDRETLQEFSRELGAQSAHVQDMGGQLTQLSKRLLACESKLAAARSRIASLEKGLEAAAALDDLLRDGTPLHAGFMALISTAVGNALRGFSPSPSGGGDLSALEARFGARIDAVVERMDSLGRALDSCARSEDANAQFERLDARIWNVDVRMEALEKKVDDLARTFSTEMEKAASATVARVLQEEISRLLRE